MRKVTKRNLSSTTRLCRQGAWRRSQILTRLSCKSWWIIWAQSWSRLLKAGIFPSLGTLQCSILSAKSKIKVKNHRTSKSWFSIQSWNPESRASQLNWLKSLRPQTSLTSSTKILARNSKTGANLAKSSQSGKFQVCLRLSFLWMFKIFQLIRKNRKRRKKVPNIIQILLTLSLPV